MDFKDNATLVVSADASERALYSGWLRADGFRVAEADSTANAVLKHRRGSFPLTIADLTGPAIDGAEFLAAVRDLNPLAEIMMLGTRDTAHTGVAALKAGAADFLLKPIHRDALLQSVRKIVAQDEVREENRRLREAMHRRFDFSQIVACSSRMLQVLSLAGRVAPTEASALITGESGTGKELLACAIHANSDRAHRPLVAINCAAIPETLIESELFGYKKGAFTGADADKCGLLSAADGGTLFLDEVAELPVHMQPKLLRFLQDGKFFALGSPQARRADVRVIAASNADLRARAESGAFRKDLYYRLAVFPLHIPPLREHPQDIMPLAHHFLDQIAGQMGKRVPGLSREVEHYLLSRPWRGNIRELRNAIERAVIVSDSNLLTSADFRTLDCHTSPEPDNGNGSWSLPAQGLNLPEINRDLIRQSLERTGYNVSSAARLLGLTRPALRYRMQKYGIGEADTSSPARSAVARKEPTGT